MAAIIVGILIGLTVSVFTLLFAEILSDINLDRAFMMALQRRKEGRK